MWAGGAGGREDQEQQQLLPPGHLLLRHHPPPRPRLHHYQSPYEDSQPRAATEVRFVAQQAQRHKNYLLFFRLKIADDDSKSVPDKLQLMDSRVESVVTNQSQLAETLKQLGLALKESQGSLVSLNTSIAQDRHSIAGQSLKLNGVRQDLELLANISRNNEDSIKQITDILTSLNINQSSLVKPASRGREGGHH